MISIVMVTFNRLQLVRQCYEKVLCRTSSQTNQIIIWDNASTDGTGEFLKSLQDSRLRVFTSKTNVATNAYAKAFTYAESEHLIELDDDVIDAPMNWDALMLEAFQKLPQMGYLAADVIDDGKSVAADIRYRKDVHRYTQRVVNGVTSRAIYDQVGGFIVNKKFNFWHEDGYYVGAVLRAGYACALLSDVKVFHASGPAYSSDPEVTVAKGAYYRWCSKRLARRKAIRRVIDRIPVVNSVYARLRPKHW
jgi:GT2 family glycosyltransferase